jgi:hypothetical protein
MKKQITVKHHEGKFLLIGSDGYSTTVKRWVFQQDAEKARAREQKLEDAGKPSRMKWEY